MKNIVILILCFCLSGCAYFNFQPGSLTVQIGALNAGGEFAYANKDKVEDAHKLCDAIINSKGSLDYLFDLTKKEAAKVIAKNETQALSLEILLNSLAVDGELDTSKFKEAAVYFKKGMDTRSK